MRGPEEYDIPNEYENNIQIEQPKLHDNYYQD